MEFPLFDMLSTGIVLYWCTIFSLGSLLTIKRLGLA